MLEAGMLVTSLAGHDKGKVFVAVSVTDTEVLLADGRGRTAVKPKRKNRKHVALIRQYCPDPADDAQIRKTIEAYRKARQR